MGLQVQPGQIIEIPQDSPPVASWVQLAVNPPTQEGNQVYSCPVCLGNTGAFWAHQTVIIDGTTYDGSKHPVHPDCIKEWVQRNPICPSCKVPTDANFVSFKEKVMRATTTTVTDAIEGGAHTDNGLYYGIMTIAMVAALEFSGYKKGKDIAAIAGSMYILGATLSGAYSIYSRIKNEPEMTTKEGIPWVSHTAAITGIVTGLFLTLQNKYNEDPFSPYFGMVFFLRSVGLKDVATGAAAGGTISYLLSLAPKWLKLTETSAAAVAGASTALVQYRGHPPAITAMCMKSAWTVGGIAYTALHSYRSYFLMGAFAGAWATIATKWLNGSWEATSNKYVEWRKATEERERIEAEIRRHEHLRRTWGPLAGAANWVSSRL